MDIQDVIRKQKDAINSVIETTLADSTLITKYADNFNFVSDFEKLIEVVGDRSEKQVFLAAINEFQFALLSSTAGLYRQAFSSLRLFLELALAGIEYSTNERKLREWKNGKLDISWSQLTCDQEGILSVKFIKLFDERLVDQASSFLAMTIRVYRECSEYVHGNPESYASLPKDIQFSVETADQWNEKACTIKLIICFAFYVRFLTEKNISELTSVENVICEQLGHIEEIRRKFGGVTNVQE